MSRISLADVLELSVAERIQLAEDIWDPIPKASEAPKLTDAQRAELDRRLEAHRMTTR
jgi:putative addiction module component (TIGR02574 family)